jgi:two-component sensor histidine kinase
MAIAAADLMGKALDAIRAGFGLVDPARETVAMQPEWCAPGVSSVAGIHNFRDYGSFIEDLRRGETVVITDVIEDPRTAAYAETLLAIDIRVLVNLPILDHGRFNLVVFVHHDQPHEWTKDELTFVRSFGDRVQMAIARLQSEAEQVTLNREMGHRLKNTFAMIQAIANQTLRPVTERNYVQNFENRLHALSRAHDILLNEQAGAPFGAIVEGLAETLGMRDRIEIDGPKILLGPRGALSLGLLLHELGTNALKYGAWSQPGGKVHVRWSPNDDGPETMLNFSWVEMGGPAPTKPERRGFGSKLIQMGLIGTGDVVVSYDVPGFSANMSASLQQLEQAN